MIESRCGLLCSECKYRDIMKCAGCLKIKKPYWAKSCPIKNCCESKKRSTAASATAFPASSCTSSPTTLPPAAKGRASSS